MKQELRERAERLQEIEQRAEKATPGPWKRIVWNGHRQTTIAQEATGIYVATAEWTSNVENNADFIEHVRADIPYLLAELRSQREATIRECAEIADNASGENAQSYDGGGWDCACGAIEGRILALLKTKGGDDE